MPAPSGVGKVFGHYRLIEQIGAGGMGVVYRAQDEQLRRDVAVKILSHDLFSDPARRERLRREALAVGRLNHPNIAMAFDFGQQDGIDYLVTEYIPGINLDEKIGGQALPQKMVLELGIQLMSGLEAAHRAEVIHRDLKPGNIRINRDEQLKVLDFGLAKMIGPIDESAETTNLDSQISVSGTLPYIAPELLRAEPADARADIWAAGAVLYEMATGKRAFPDRQPSLVIDAILHYDPVRPTLINPNVPAGLETVILKALDRDPNRRYQTARELRVDLVRLLSGEEIAGDLKRTGSGETAVPVVLPPGHMDLRIWRWPIIALAVLLVVAAAGTGVWRNIRPAGNGRAIHSIAVLPFTDLSPGGGQQYFADGMTEELINDLSRISALRVISRTSAMQYRNVHKPVSEIARELNVDGVVEGTVQRSEGRVKVSADLVNAREDRSLWGHSYESDMRDVLSLQSEIAQAIAGEIQVQLSPAESALLARKRTVNPQAYETYLHALYLWNKRTPDGLRSALVEFRKAIDQDPTSALSWAGLADCYALLSSWDEVAPRDAMPLAEAAAQKALQLDNSLAQAHASLAITKWTYDWDRAGAGEEFARAVELNPNYAVGHEWYGLYLSYTGQFDRALRVMQRAHELDPLSLVIRVNVARCYYYSRQYGTAVNMLKKLEQEEPQSWIVPAMLGLTYLAEGTLDDAIRELENARRLSPSAPLILGLLGDTYGRAGRRDSALQIAGDLDSLSLSRYVPPVYSALVYMGMGDKARAFAFLDKAYADRSEWMMELEVEPEFDPLRADPRFRSLLQRVAERAADSPE